MASSGAGRVASTATHNGAGGLSVVRVPQAPAPPVVEHQALTDALTSLPQRPIVREWLHGALTALPPGRHAAVALLNVDGFSVVIESLGMLAADAALLQLTGRLRTAAAEADIGLARAGGDEFALVLPEVGGAAAAERAVNEIVEAAFGRPLSVHGQVLYLTASCGVALSPPADADELLRRATVALVSTKRAGGGRTATYQSRRSKAPRDLALHAEMREALARGELSPHYQPIVDVNDSRVVGLEALLRWNHPVRGIVGPAEFLAPIAGSLLIEELGIRVLRQACQDAAALTTSHPDVTYVAVNVAPRQLTARDFHEHVLAALADAGLGPQRLVLEITETALVHDLSVARAALNTLRAHGIRIALDDFGTGYATLTSLRQLPIDMLKIDRTFVAGLGESDQDARIVASVVSLAKSIGIHAVAEGVETLRQADAVRAVGCGLGQGYYWSAAVPASDLPETLTRITSAGHPTARTGKVELLSKTSPVETRRIIELHRAGASPQTIAAALNQAGLQTSVGRRWHAAQVVRVIETTTALARRDTTPGTSADAADPDPIP